MKLIANLHDIDQKAVSQWAIPAETLMESAGARVAEAVQTCCSAIQRGVIVCGPGNNGGDGFVCARKLYEFGFHAITVVYTGQQYRNEALANLEKLMISLPVPLVNAQKQPDLATRHIQEAEFIVDALFGSGLARSISGLEARLVEAINATSSEKHAWVMAVDMPSGIDGSSGQVLGCAVRADATVTFAAAKPGLYLQPGKSHAGAVSLVDIGLPARLIETDESPLRLIDSAQARQWLPIRHAESHKYQHGNVLVIAGSQAMPGAAVLCSEAAMNAGAGLVTLAAPETVFQQLPMLPEVMRLPLPDAAQLGEPSIETIQQAIAAKRYNTVLIGPGLGRAAEVVRAIQNLLVCLKSLKIPVIVDADGLNALGEKPIPLGESFILTPHVGEAARLLGEEAAAIAADLPGAAARIREKYGAQVVLKSASTVIATMRLRQDGSPGAAHADAEGQGGQLLWISPTGNPGMATAGSGDVLSGIIAAQAAQLQAHAPQSNGWQAAPLGVYIHGLAGDAAAQALTPYAMRASRITEYLPQAFRQVLNP